MMHNLAVRTALGRHGLAKMHIRPISSSRPRTQDSRPIDKSYVDVEKLLANPTWSVSALLPSKDHSQEKTAISSKQLHHLLRLSALPPPKDEHEEAEMISTLESQLHFVKEIQKVDTSGVEPFRSLRDETAGGDKEAELGLAAMQDTLAHEELRGKHHKRIRRRREGNGAGSPDHWNVLDTASRKIGRYFVVEGGKGG